MTHFETNRNRMDPYRNFKFRVKWDGEYVAGVSHISPLTWIAEVVEIEEGGDPRAVHKVPGNQKFPPITLERGFTHDTAFEDWANEVRSAGSGATNYHKDVVVDVFDEGDRRVLSFLVHHCWVSEYQAVPDIDRGGNAAAIEVIKLENEGWERDRTVEPPVGGLTHRATERRKR